MQVLTGRCGARKLLSGGSIFKYLRSHLPSITAQPLVVNSPDCRRSSCSIRWDAWYNWTGDPNDPSAWVARALTPVEWHDRLPWYSYIEPSGNVTFDGISPATMAAEIAFAVENGVDHWAFDVYPPDEPMSGALYSYLNYTGPLKADLGFCLLLQSSWMSSGGLAAWPAKVAIYAQHFARPEYTVVLDNRPLVYLFSVTESAWGNASAGWADWQTALTMLSEASVAAGRGPPYIALQTWSASDGYSQLQGINSGGGGTVPLVAALSAYALGGATDAGTPFAQFAAEGVAFWDSLAATGADVVVPVAAGWDQRPRVDCPPPWVPHPDPAYVVMPTPTEMGAFVAAALNWTAAHAHANPAKVHRE
jgi:hypothetical protein